MIDKILNVRKEIENELIWNQIIHKSRYIQIREEQIKDNIVERGVNNMGKKE